MGPWKDRARVIIVYLGTHKCCVLEVLIGEAEPQVLNFVLEENPAGFESGMVTNLEAAASTLEKLLDRLLPNRGFQDLSVYVVLGNSN